jgi:hypothetical protein
MYMFFFSMIGYSWNASSFDCAVEVTDKNFVRGKWIFNISVVERVVASDCENFARCIKLFGHVRLGGRICSPSKIVKAIIGSSNIL